mmetsp:Transcript_5697/g.12634  ORF Transcript_5697/g.12634 Transcript_5697/m.12634 type:complete len:83 (-) Transcript_5697:25-273(-)
MSIIIIIISNTTDSINILHLPTTPFVYLCTAHSPQLKSFHSISSLSVVSPHHATHSLQSKRTCSPDLSALVHVQEGGNAAYR